MAYQFKPFEKAVGSFVIAGISTLLISGLFIARKKGLLFGAKGTEYVAYYKKGDSVGESMKVIYNGFPIGKTMGRELMPDDRVRVRFMVESKYTNRVHVDSVAWLHDGILPGSSSIRITKGRDTSAFMAAGGTLWSSDDPEGVATAKEINGRVLPPTWMDKMVQVIFDLIEMLGRDDGPVMKLLASLNHLMQTDPGSPIGRILGVSQELLGNIGAIMGQVKSPDTSVGALLGDNKIFYSRLMGILRSTDETMKNSAILTRNLSQMGLLGGNNNRDTRGVTPDKNDRFENYSNR